MAQYDLGDVIRQTATFTDTAGAATDPATVTFTFTNPAGTAVTYTYGTDAQPVRSAEGIYYVDISANLEGIWRWHWTSTGSGAASTEGQFAVVRTTVRAGMQNLINRVRALTGAGQSEYTVGDYTYWSDENLQTILDARSQFIVGGPLTWQPQTIAGGTITYLTAQAGYRDLEEGPAGTATSSRFVIRDSTGAAVGTANYSVDYQAGRVTFTGDQGGTAYYFTGYTYDVCAAAADVLRERLANFNLYYDFSADNQSFSRSQVRKQIAEAMADLRGCAGSNVAGATSGDLHVSQFVRTDINRGFGYYGND